VQPSNPIESQEKAEVEQAERVAQKTHISKGEHMFDWLTYGGIGFASVFAAGIPIVHWAKYGKGAKVFADSAKSLEKLGMNATSAEDAVMTTALMIPGNLGLIPIKQMEDHKPELVQKFNTMLGDKSGDASVDKEPEQSWGSLIKARLVAWVAVYAGFRGAAHAIGQKQFLDFENKFAEHAVCKPLGKPTHIPGMAKIVANETKVFRYGKIAALDIFATATATTLLYIGSRFFAGENARWKAHDLPKDTPDNTPSSPPQAAITATPPMDNTKVPSYIAKMTAAPHNSFVDSVANSKNLSGPPSLPL